MDYFVVYLKSMKYFTVHRKWIQNPVVGEQSKIFYSSNFNDVADFTCAVLYFLDKSVAACYNAFVYKVFGEISKNIQYLNNN